MPEANTKKVLVALCETQPATAEGVRALLSECADLECAWAVPSLPVAVQLNAQQPADVLLLDKAFGPQLLAGALSELRSSSPATAVVVWGNHISEADALQLLQAGVRGLLRKTSELAEILTCLRTVAAGSTRLAEGIFRERFDPRSGGNELTPRERQVLELVEKGLKNKEIAAALGIRPGTVKIHMKHIFEKTGVHGRYGLALSSLRQRAPVELPDWTRLSRSA